MPIAYRYNMTKNLHENLVHGRKNLLLLYARRLIGCGIHAPLIDLEVLQELDAAVEEEQPDHTDHQTNDRLHIKSIAHDEALTSSVSTGLTLLGIRACARSNVQHLVVEVATQALARGKVIHNG